MKKLLLFLLIFLPEVFAQNSITAVDSIVDEYISLNSPEHDHSGGKCGFRVSGALRSVYNDLSPLQKKQLEPYLQRPVKQKSFVSPSGKFRIHYDTTGNAKPGYDLNQLAIAFDSAYNYEVNFLGFLPPPSDNNNGGDNLYDIYVVDLGSNGSGIYGSTEFEDYLGGGKYTSYIRIDNDFLGFYSEGIYGARVTAAHELHHSIQIGNYYYRDSDLTFYELTSTAMEEFVYDSINDYYAYMTDYFNYPNQQFTSYDGYDLALWNIYLRDYYKDYSMFKKQWEQMSLYPAVKCIENTLLQKGSSFVKELNRFAVWCYYTNYRYIPGKFFEEGKNYPALKPFRYVNITTYPLEYSVNTQPLSNKYFAFINKAKNDTLISIITNGDVESAVDSPSVMKHSDYFLYNSEGTGRIKIADGYYIYTESNMPLYWAYAEVLNNILVRADSSYSPPSANESAIEYSFPNPFYLNKNYQTGKNIFFTLESVSAENADLKIYTAGMKLIYSGSLKINNSFLNSKTKIVVWDLSTIDNCVPATGVYLYLIKAGDYSKKGKFVIINDK